MTLVEQTVHSAATQFVASGAGWSTVTDANASGGSYDKTAGGGDSVAITVAAGYTGVLLIGTRIGRGNVATVTVDGTPYPDWSQDDFTTAAASAGQTFTSGVSGIAVPVAWYKSAYQPIYFANTGIAHTIVVGVRSGTITIDAVECYTAELVVAGRVLSFGMSITQGAELAAPTTQRYGALVAAALGPGYAEENQGLPSEALQNGWATIPSSGWARAMSNGSGAAAHATLSGGVVNAVVVDTVGTNWWGPPTAAFAGGAPANAAAAFMAVNGTGGISVGTGFTLSGGSGYGSAPTIAFTPAWWPRTPEVALFCHGINDTQIYGTQDPGGGVGYCLEAWKQRMRECFWRMNLNSPATLICSIGLTWVRAAWSATPESTRMLWNRHQAAVTAEPTMQNICWANVYQRMVNEGGDLLISGVSNVHPLAAGHAIIADEAIKAITGRRSTPRAARMGIAF